MADAKYLANRLKYHTASRIATQTGEALAQALNVDGHIVTTNKVWAAPQTSFVNNVNKGNTDSVDATNDLVAAFKTPVYYKVTETKFAEKTTYYVLVDGKYVETAVTAGETIPEETEYYTSSVKSEQFWATDQNGNKNGKVWTNTVYPAVKLYENVPMTVVSGSDGGGKFQAFEILADEDGVSQGTKRIVDWIAPTAVADQENGSPVAGYSGIPMYNGTALKLADTSKWAEAGGHYEFAYIAGMLTFEPGYTPQDKATAAVNTTTGKTYISLTAFKYVGEYVDAVLDSHDSRLDAVESQLGLGSAEDGSLTDRVKELEDTVAPYTSKNTIKSAIDTEKTAREAIKIVKIATNDGYAASYQLQGLSGAVLGDTINIAKDQFLKGAKITTGSLADNGTFTESTDGETFIHFTFEINKKGDDGKVTSDVNNVYLNIHDLVDVYTGGLAIEVTSDNVINLVKSNKSEEFFFVDSTGAGVSGIQDAIDFAVSGVISGVAEIPTTTTGFNYNTLVFTADGETAIVDVVNNKVVDISEENVETITTTTLSSSLPTVGALTGYVKESISNENFLKEVEVSGAEALSITEKANNKQTISLAISTQSGNAIVDAASGLFVQKYVAGENITLSANANGEMTINGSNSYELPVATDTILGGVKAGDDISVDVNGEVTVLQANKVKHTLKAGDKNFDGVSNIEILASDLGALTSVTAGAGIAVSTKSGDSQSISLDLKSDDKYLTLSGNALASKGIDEAIEAASGSIVTSFIEALNEEILARESGDNFITGTLLSGYSAINTVKAAEEALDLRLDAVETQLGLGGGGNGNSSVTERLVEVEKTISAYTSTNTISSAIGSISSNVGSLLPLLGLEIQEADTTAGYAATYRLADKSGKQYGSVINIPKDQFLSGAEYDAEAKALKLTFALNGIDSQGFPTVTENVATIPVEHLVDTYTAGNGITLENNQFSLVKDTDTDSKFLQIGTNTIGLSGVTEAIEYAVRTKAELADYTADGTAASGTIQYAIRQNTAAINKLNGDKTVSGSVDYKIDQYDQTISTLITEINTLKDEIK